MIWSKCCLVLKNCITVNRSNSLNLPDCSNTRDAPDFLSLKILWFCCSVLVFMKWIRGDFKMVRHTLCFWCSLRILGYHLTPLSVVYSNCKLTSVMMCQWKKSPSFLKFIKFHHPPSSTKHILYFKQVPYVDLRLSVIASNMLQGQQTWCHWRKKKK